VLQYADLLVYISYPGAGLQQRRCSSLFVLPEQSIQAFSVFAHWGVVIGYYSNLKVYLNIIINLALIIRNKEMPINIIYLVQNHQQGVTGVWEVN
jgi:hypothetical protein